MTIIHSNIITNKNKNVQLLKKKKKSVVIKHLKWQYTAYIFFY